MGTFKKIRSTAKCILFVFLVLNVVESKRSGGSRHRPSPSPHRSRHPSPSSHPSPVSHQPASHPSPSPSHSATHTAAAGPSNYGLNSAATHGSGSNYGTNGNTGFHGANSPQIGFKPSLTRDSSHGSSAAKPHPYGFKPSAAVGPPTNVKSVGNAPPGAPYPIHPPPYTPQNPGIPPPAYNPAHNPAGYGPPPAYNPSYNPASYGHASAYNPGYGHANYPQQQYHGSYGAQHPSGVSNININNINTHNNHHYGGGGYSGGFGSYGTGFGYHSYPTYHYSSGDTGSGTLGFYLGYSLAKVTTPTFHSHSSFYNGYTPRYDHYEVHHYYHNRDSVPVQSTIQPNTIVGCIGDSGTICPTGTTSLCTSNGAILCVASATSTVPCADQKQGNCVKTTIPCVNGTGDCEIGTNKTVTIPCISSARIPGNITYVNNTIIVNQSNITNNNFNGTTNATVAVSNGSTLMSSSSGNITSSTTKVPTTIAEFSSSILMSLRSLSNDTTNEAYLEMAAALAAVNEITGDDTRLRRDTSAVPINEFCVTILALPAERKPTEQENVLSKGTGIFSKFLVKALGAN